MATPRKANPQKTGRPRLYDDDTLNAYLVEMGKGKLLIEISAMKGMPSMDTVMRRCDENPLFRAAFNRARIMQARAVIEAATKAVHSGAKDMANILRLQWDAAKWYAARNDPANWAEKTQIANHSGTGDPSVTHVTYQWASPEPPSKPAVEAPERRETRH